MPQPGLFPCVMSLSASFASEYRSGFKNPRGFPPFLKIASFNNATMPATVGLAALVPETDIV